MVVVDDSCLQADSVQVRQLGLRVDGRLCTALHSSNEPSELSQWPVVMMTALSSWYYYYYYYYYYYTSSSDTRHKLS